MTTDTALAAAELGRVHAAPYDWPVDASLDEVVPALICIDFQYDFLRPGGFADRMGLPIANLAPAVPVARRVLDAVRSLGWTVVHTRVGHRPDLSDCPPRRHRRAAQREVHPGAPGPYGRHLVRGEPTWDLIDEMAAAPGEIVIDKTGKGAFHATELDVVLRNRGITHLLSVGVTSDVCVQTTFREAADRGYEPMLVADATAAYVPEDHEAALRAAATQFGIFGTVGWSDAVLATLATLGGRT